MRITLVVQAFPVISETFIVNKFLGLLAAGHKVTVVCDRSGKAEWRHFSELSANPGFRRKMKVNWPHTPRLLPVILWLPGLIRLISASPAATVRYILRGFKLIGA